MTAAIIAQNTLLKMADSGGSVFTTVAEVDDINGPTDTFDIIEATSHDSPNSRKEFIAGLLDGGELSFDIHFVPTNQTHIDLQSVHDNRQTRNWQLIFPDSSTFAFAGLIPGFEVQAPADGELLTASVTIKVTGNITRT